jgi:hypothetical protein
MGPSSGINGREKEANSHHVGRSAAYRRNSVFISVAVELARTLRVIVAHESCLYAERNPTRRRAISKAAGSRIGADLRKRSCFVTCVTQTIRGVHLLSSSSSSRATTPRCRTSDATSDTHFGVLLRRPAHDSAHRPDPRHSERRGQKGILPRQHVPHLLFPTLSPFSPCLNFEFAALVHNTTLLHCFSPSSTRE